MADFGIVRIAPGLTTEQLTRINGLTGSQGWAAPEQYRNAHVATVTADVYGLGGVLSWMLTGDQPSYGSVSLPSEPRLRAALRRATNPTPTDRFPDLDALVAAVKASLSTPAATFESLVHAQDWASAGAFVAGHPAQVDRVMTVMRRLKPEQIRRWLRTDRAGLSASVVDVAQSMADDYSQLSFSDIDAFLIWSVSVIRELLGTGAHASAEEVAVAVFGAAARIHQFEPAKAILDFLNRLDPPAQWAMEAAMHASDSYDFFSAQVQNRWHSRGESDLILKLRES